MNDLEYFSESYDVNDYNYYTRNKRGEIHGKFITGDCCNSVETVYNYINHKKEGYSSTYYKDSKTIISESHYKNDNLDGVYKEYYIDTVIKIICNYKNGKKNGKYQEFFSNSSRKIECYYLDDILSGSYTEWNKEGKVIKNILN
jgi:antitoxin component YwqK of YwqJK toxin-antitoxin module